MIRRGRLLVSFGNRPLQASKLIGIVLGLLVGLGGFFQLITTDAVVDEPVVADGQFLTGVVVSIVGLALIGIVVVETLATGYRVVRADESVERQAAGRVGYVLIRAVEAGVAAIGLLFVVRMDPTLVVVSAPEAGGIGSMVELTTVGGGILLASLVRSAAELHWVGGGE